MIKSTISNQSLVPEQDCTLAVRKSKRFGELPPLSPKTKQKMIAMKDPVVFIAKERRDRRLAAFRISQHLSDLARRHAEAMATATSVYHSVASVSELQRLLGRGMVGENVQCGDSFANMHHETMRCNAINRSNILSRHFTEIGTGSAVGSDGMIYSCQMFRD
jgi:uncharacterized protein YkwD